MAESVEKIFSSFLSLSETDRNKLLDKIKNTIELKDESLEKALLNIRFNDSKKICPICGSHHVLKNGHRKTGEQKFICKNCGKSFMITTNSIFSGTTKELSTWKNYFECIMRGFSIRTSAEICNISVSTSFYWRHKILSTLKKMADDIVLEDNVETDETFFRKSYKGNHKKSSFKMPRKPYKRGKSTKKRGISKELTCVPCAVNGKGLSISLLTNAGHVSTEALNIAFKDKIKKKTIICTDSNSSYKKFSIDNSLKLIQIKPGKYSNGVFTIQHINNYHRILKSFMYRFNGVSSKHLNNYLLWNNFKNISNGSHNEKKNILINFVMSQYQKTTNKSIPAKPPMPLLC